MNRLLPTTGVSLVLFILGGLLSFTEPASFLDQIQNRIMFALMPAQRETAVCKITIPENATADEVAGLILRLKSRGTKGVILMGKIDGAADSDLFASAIADTNVVWIFDPQMLDSKLRDKANCLPLLHLQEFSSVIIATSISNRISRSATALALSCVGDIKTLDRIADNSLKIPFLRNGFDATDSSKNFTLACITKEDTHTAIKYITQAGIRSKSEYVLDICQALLNRYFLINPSQFITIPIAGLAAFFIARFNQSRVRLFVFASICLAFAVVEIVAKWHLPLCEVTLIYLSSLIVFPILTGWLTVRKMLASELKSFFQSPASMLGAFLIIAAALWEYFFQHYEHEQASQFLALIIFVVFVYLLKGLSQENRLLVGRNLMTVFVVVAFFMALRPHLFQPNPNLDAYYRNMTRWRGWTIDPNNSALVVGLCGIIALRLRNSFSKPLSRFFIFVSVICLMQLFRSYSRIGLLSVVIGTYFCVAPRWEQISIKSKVRIQYLFLLLIAMFPFALSWLHGSENLLIRRAVSFTNFMDLSWANRLYVLPGTIQAALCKPILGWGWGHVLQIHQKLFCPTFLNDNTAILLNDYAHIAASYGLIVFSVVVFFVIWGCLTKGDSNVKLVFVVGAVAMFFQGVIRIPFVLAPFVLSLALLAAEFPPWKIQSWRNIKIPVVAILPIGVFLFFWCALPLLHTSKSIACHANEFVISNSNADKFVMAFTDSKDVLTRGRQARAASSLGAKCILTEPEKIDELKATYGSNVWFLGVTNELQSLQIKDIKSKSQGEIGVWAVRMAYDGGQNEVPMCPDKPFDLAWVVAALFFSGAIFIVANIFFISRNRIMALMAGTAALVAIFCSKTAHDDWIVENQETADYARQMRSAVIPDDIYFAYVLNPDISQNFRIRHRREIWHTFYQTSRAENLAELIEKLKESINLQFLIRPEDSQSLGSFETLWQNRSCNLHERWYLLAAVLRTLDVPARLSQDRLQVWDADGWHDVAR